MSRRDDEGSILNRRLARRTFLKVAGLSPVGLLGARPILAAAAAGTPSDLAPAAEAPLESILQKALDLEFDTEKIFRFVADEIRYEPYAGILRGARGTLASRAGNSADQAVLLASLLSAAAIPVRFRSGSLTVDQRDALLSGADMDVAAARAQLDEALRATAPVEPEPDPVLTAEQLGVIASVPDLVDRSVRLVGDRVDRATEHLAEALRAAGVQMPDGLTPLPDLEATQHTWVQVASGPEWVDLDPTMPGATAGLVHAEPTGEPLEALPDELRHRVDFVVTTESLSGGQLSQSAVIEHSAFADELAGQPISLSHEKPEGLKALGLALESALAGGIRYQPILSVGDITLVGIEPLAFGTGGGFFAETDGSLVSDGEATAEWLDIRVVSPDRDTTARRTLFDRIGEAARDGGPVDVASIEPVELIDIDDELTEEFAPMRVAHLMSVATGTTSIDRFVDVSEASTDADVLSLYPATFHILRDALSGAVGLPRGYRTFIDAPNVVAYSISLQPGARDPGEERVDLAVDLLVRSSGRAALVGSAPPAAAGLIAGVLEHEAERLAAGDGLSGEPFPELHVASVGAVFEAADAQGVSTRVLRQASEADALPLDPDVAGRLKAGLQEGWVAVIPERPVQLNGRDRIGWWLIDPGTGAAVDVFEDGRSSAMTEESFLYNRIAFWVRKFVCLGLAIKQLKTYAKLISRDYEGFVVGMAIGYPLHYLLGGHCH